MQVDIPEKLMFMLTSKARYIGARGGRGSAKSWTVARIMLILGTTRRMRFLCTREVQKSIKQSVHKLLKDQIEALGLQRFYQVLDTEIRGKNGTEFAFSGLSDQTADSIKSFEGVDFCWVEEAQSISKNSWKILIPTIRKETIDPATGELRLSQICLTFNPELETDETFDRFVTNPPDSCEIVEMNHSDNPWFPSSLEAERLHAKKTMTKAEYDNVWEGKCMPAVAGAIYFNEMTAMEEQKRICNVPYDPMLKVHVVFDLGWNDSMAISLVQKHASEIRLIWYLEQSFKTLDYYSNELKQLRYNWGNVYLPHDGRTKDYKSGKSAEQIMNDLGWTVKITPNMSVEDGIKMTRMTLGRMYVDKVKCERLMQCAKRYRRSINQQTQEPGAPLHDEWSHGADNLRYVAVNAEDMTNDDWGKLPPLEQPQPDEVGIYF